MTDLETRVRDGLHADVEQPDTEAFLTGVRRGVTWRRGRRAAAAAALAVVVLVGGSVLLQQGHDPRTAPQPVTRGPSPTSAPTDPGPGAGVGRVVDLTAAGDHVYRLTWNLGCSACSSVWVRDASDAWTRLYDFAGSAAYGGRVTPRYGPVDSLVLAPNGRDGWAVGRLLWATHDGGRTWSQVEGGPGPRTVFGRDVAVGAHVAWGVRNGVDHVGLWRTDVGSDTWHRVGGVPRLRHLVGLAGVTDDDRVALLVSGEGGSDNALVVGGPGAWTQVPLASGADARVRTDGTTFWASVPEAHGSRMFRLDGGAWHGLGRTIARNWLPLDDQRVLLDRPTALVLTASGTEATDLQPGAGILGLSRTTDGTFWLLTMSGRVYTSTDTLGWSLRP